MNRNLKWMFGVIFPDGHKEIHFAPSSNQAKHLRKAIIPAKPEYISPIVRATGYEPESFFKGRKIIKVVNDGRH